MAPNLRDHWVEQNLYDGNVYFKNVNLKNYFFLK